jgi:hypothetical protein
MGLFDSIGSFISDVGDWVKENPLVGSIASTALTGYALYKVNQSTRSEQSKQAVSNTPPTYSSISPATGAQTSVVTGGGTASSSAPTTTGTSVTTSPAAPIPDPGAIIQIPPNQDKKIPIVYGRATVAGIITEAVQKDNNKKMVYVVTISETTGNLMSSNFATPSHYHFNRVFWNDRRVVFKADGVTVNYITDRVGNIDYGPKDLVKIWLYAGGVNPEKQVAPEGWAITPTSAITLVPGWGGSHQMSDLVFAVIEVTYNKEKGVIALPNMTFTMTNSLSQPGDVLCDYMVNTRYGAGIPIEDILVS